MTTLFTSLTESDKRGAVERLIADSTPRDDFFLMIVLSVVMATFGLLMGSGSIIIGSMLIAPLLSPILGFSMGIVMADRALIVRSALTVLKSMAFALPASIVVALFFSRLAGLGPELNLEIVARLEPDVISAFVALVAGLAASYAIVRPQLSASLPGVVVSVALIPPLAVTGIGIARFDWAIIADSFVLFLINVALIVFASSVVFSLTRLYTKQPLAEQALKKEDEKMRREVERSNGHR
ncbi:MAG: TIGR00341 family protein [bacterium]